MHMSSSPADPAARAPIVCSTLNSESRSSGPCRSELQSAVGASTEQMEGIPDSARGVMTKMATSPLLLLVLFGLEELMEMDFDCPDAREVGIVYSLMFIFGTTAIICMFTCSCWCKCCGTRSEGGDIEEGPCSYQECTDRGCCCTLSCYKFVMSWNIPLLWLFILVIDGRYFQCLVTSIRTSEGIVTVEDVWREFPRQTVQVTGMGLILTLGLVYLCKCGTRSEYLQTKHKDSIRRYTQKALEKHKEEKLEDFVKQQVNEYLEKLQKTDKELPKWDPKLLNALEEWEQISMDCREEVVGKLKRPGGPPQTPGATEKTKGGPPQTPGATEKTRWGHPQTPGATDKAGGPPQTPGATDKAGGPPQTPGATDKAGGPPQTPGATEKTKGGPSQTPGAIDIPLDGNQEASV